MSIKDFSNALKSQALKSWFQRLSTDNILKASSRDIRKKESGKEFNSFYITTKTISDVIEKLSGAEASPEMVTAVFKKLQNTVYNRKNKAKTLTEPYVEGEALYFPRVSFDGINNLLDTGFSEVLAEARARNPDVRISDFFQKGHVFGIFPKKVAETRKSLSNNTTLTPEARAMLVGFLTDLEAQLEEEDLATSNLKTPRFELYARYKKKSSRYLVELQLTEANEAAGRAQATLSKAIRKYLNPAKVAFTANGIKFTEGEAEQRIKGLMTSNAEKVLGSKGSPSYYDLMADAIVDALEGKKRSNKEYKTGYVQVAKSRASKIDTSKANAEIKRTKAQVKKLKQSVQTVPMYKRFTGLESISSLEAILRARINLQVAKNMGSGTSKTLLNYRTGRLADSVSIERLTESRTGMISVFYNYMKNPYATFSDGGMRQYPKSRDPKLLISKSIREIAAENAVTRLRSVLV